CAHQEENKACRNQVCGRQPINAQEAWNYHLARVDNSHYSRLFVGQLESSLTCQTCTNTSLSWNCFWQLPLHIGESDRTPGSVEDCIREYSAVEVIWQIWSWSV